MTLLKTRESSLLATAGNRPTEWWLVYSDVENLRWWNRFLDPRFRHVEALRRDGRVWIALRPHAEFMDVEIIRSDETPWQLAPGAIVQRVVAFRLEGEVRSPWHTGPITCVEYMKALLGIRAWWVRTPRQLFHYCRRTSCVLGRDQLGTRHG